MNKDLIERNETNQNSKGGTELLQDRLYDGSVPRELLEQFQIVFSRVRDLDESKFRIYYAHDLAGDPEATKALGNDGWRKFHKLVFVSNWQMQAYINYYQIPWSACEVIENSILPIEDVEFEKDPEDKTIRLVYTPTPHRGLHILYAAFDALSKKHDNIELDVYSSFKLYGWEERDAQYKELFDRLDAHPKINNIGTVENEQIRELLKMYDIFAYPSIWPETSCLCLIEAMSAGVTCIHSNFGGLPDTASGFTYMYQMEEDDNRHATKLYHLLDNAIPFLNSEEITVKRRMAKMYADNRFNWNIQATRWSALLQNIVDQNPSKALSKTPTFEYNV